MNKTIESLPKEDLASSQPTSTWSHLVDSLKDNPYFSAGFGLVGIGALLSILKKSTSLGYTLAQRNFTVSLEIISKDKSYEWALKWVNDQLERRRAQHISVNTMFKKNESNQRISTSFSFEPSIGVHYFTYKGRWVRAERTREQIVDRNTGSPVETLKLTTLGRDIGFFSQMLVEARSMALSGQSGKILIYHANLGIIKDLFNTHKECILHVLAIFKVKSGVFLAGRTIKDHFPQ